MNFSLSFQVVFPLCVYMGIGAIGRAAGLIDGKTSGAMNRFTFRTLFPLMMFENVLNAGDALGGEGIRTMLYLLAAYTAVFVLLMLVIPRFEPSRPRQGSMIQGAFRSNSILFAIPIVTTVCGAENTGTAALCVSVLVPWYNVLCVFALESKRGGRVNVRKLVRGILTNPLILGALAGVAAVLAGLQLPPVLKTPLHTLSSLVTPLSLILLGVDLRLAGIRKDWKQLALVSLIKLILMPLLLVGGAWAVGFRGVPLVSIFALSCVPTAVSSYTMAVEMGADGPLAGEILATTTVLSIFTVFLWVSVLSGMNLLAF